MANFDLDNMRFRNVGSFQGIDLSKDFDEQVLPDGNVISAKIENGSATEYAVKDPSGKLLKAIYLEMQPGSAGGAVAGRTCQVCYTDAGGVYRCVNVKCGSPVVVLTADGT